MATDKRVCPNLHLPLQAGSDHVLQLMRRHYTLQEYKDLIAKLRSRIKDLSNYDLISLQVSHKKQMKILKKH